jgi:hypothetical protein
MLHCAFGPPGLLLYGVQKIVIQFDFHGESFEWIELNSVLGHWKNLPREKFIDACLLAGTEYCLTYPYLNLEPFSHGESNFQFSVAVEFINQYSLVNWMQTISPPDLKNMYVEDCGTCKVLVQHSPIFDTHQMTVRPMSATRPKKEASDCPSDLSRIMGSRLPPKVYSLVCTGILSPWLPLCLATGEWCDRQTPLVDSCEYRQLLEDLGEYRERALGLLTASMPKYSKKVVMRTFWESRKQDGAQAPQPSMAAINPVRAQAGSYCKWNFAFADLQEEMKRQGVKDISLRFCLQWHARMFEKDSKLLTKPLTTKGKRREVENTAHLSAYVHLMLLQQIGLINDNEEMTVLGDTVKGCPAEFEEPCIVVLELMKFGLLTGDPFEPVDHKPFPAALKYPKASQTDKNLKLTMLISRVVSLVPLRLRSDMWSSEVDFDLAAFHCEVRLLKRSLRQLTEASLAHLLLEDARRMKLVPPHAMNPLHSSERIRKTGQSAPAERAVFPVFTLPRACTGIVLKYVLLHKELTIDTINQTLRKVFPACPAPWDDILNGLQFWKEVVRCVESIAEPLQAEYLLNDVREADDFLRKRFEQIGARYD